jgi:hypothetical protein
MLNDFYANRLRDYPVFKLQGFGRSCSSSKLEMADPQQGIQQAGNYGVTAAPHRLNEWSGSQLVY